MAVAVALTSGCRDGSEPLSRAEFVRKGNAICRETKAAQTKVPRPPLETLTLQFERSARGRAARRRWATYRRRVAELGERGVERLRDLDPPPDLRARRDRFFRDIAALGALARAHPAARPTPKRIRRIRGIVDRINADARGLGLRACVDD